MLPGYSTNLHRAEQLTPLLAELIPFATHIRERLGWEHLPLDLRLGDGALADLTQPGALAALRHALDRARLLTLTINGFPLGAFQAPRVKELAYTPDWSDPRRLSSSLHLLDVALALSDAPLVTISTVPCGFGRGGDHQAMARHLARWAVAAHRQWERTGRCAVLCLEPEPWCLLETSHDVAWWWSGPLLQHGLPEAKQFLGSDAQAALARHLGVCVDTCHLSVAFEEQAAAVTRMAAAGARIAKCQVSAAPEVLDPHRNTSGTAALRALAELRFLHQTAASSSTGSLTRAVDLDRLTSLLARLPNANAVRSHFHIPLFREPSSTGLSTTIDDTWRGLQASLAHGCTHFAVETYTWSILAADQQDACLGTARELALLHKHLTRAAPTSAD